MREKTKHIIFCTLLILSCSSYIKAQNNKKIDSLRFVIRSNQHDTSKVKAYAALMSIFKSKNSDTALYYGHKGLDLANKANYQKGLAKCYNNLGLVFQEQGNYDKAIESALSALKIREEIKDKKGMSASYNNIGNVYYLRGNYDNAILYYIKSLKISEELNDKEVMATNYSNIGAIYKEQENYQKAIEYGVKALRIREELNDKKGVAISYSNIGIIYGETNDHENSIKYNLNAVKIREDLGDKKGIASNYTNIGQIYEKQNNYKLSIKYYLKALKICEEIGDKGYISGVLPNISSLNLKAKNYKDALDYALRGLKIAQEIGSLENIRFSYNQLSAVYDSMGNLKQALKYHKLFMLFKDSIYNEAKHRQLYKMEAIYQNEKKQKEIELKNEKIAKSELETKQERTQKLAFIGGFALMILLSLVIFKSYRDKRKANILLAGQKREIESKNAALNQQNEEIRTQRDEIEVQRDKIGEIHKELTDSIYYAERIQKAVLPDTLMSAMLLADHFIFFKPKNIVSGDFYWMIIKKNWLLIAVADCTGHGVPGAFMSMLGISFLNEIVSREDVYESGRVLDILREYIVKSLQQKGITGEQKDGMDISFVALDLETYKIQFAGANNPLYIIRSNETDTLNDTIEMYLKQNSQEAKLFEIPPDKMPIGIHEKMANFSTHIIQLYNGDSIYLASDGFEDQFGGAKGRKFLSKQFRQVLTDMYPKTMPEQYFELEKIHDAWKNNSGQKFEQTDDITVLGLRIWDIKKSLTKF